MKIGIESWVGKVKDWKKCKKCGKDWTPRSLDKEGICPYCRDGIVIQNAPILEHLINFYDNNYDKYDDIQGMLEQEIENLLKSGEFDKEENLLRCPICSRYTLQLVYGRYSARCKECFDKMEYMERIKNENEEKIEKRRV